MGSKKTKTSTARMVSIGGTEYPFVKDISTVMTFEEETGVNTIKFNFMDDGSKANFKAIVKLIHDLIICGCQKLDSPAPALDEMISGAEIDDIYAAWRTIFIDDEKKK